jgi:nucleotide-binding universal stress UspA family protein
MYQKILLAYNGPTYCTAALRQASDLARLCKAELHLLDIVGTAGWFLIAQSESSLDLLGMERKYVQEALETAARDLAGQGLNVITSIREGEPAIEIVAHAHEIKADLAVLGHSDKGILARWFEGSTGAKLLSDLPCSLLIAIG